MDTKPAREGSTDSRRRSVEALYEAAFDAADSESNLDRKVADECDDMERVSQRSIKVTPSRQQSAGTHKK